MFPGLPAHNGCPHALMRYGDAGGPLEAVDLELDADNPRIPAGWPFFGQFIAHDITHDRAPLEEHEDLESVQNFRGPRLDLECLYGAGPVGQPYLYDIEDPDKLLIGHCGVSFEDLPRNEQGVALVGDARNDTHLFISQLHLAFLRFHNGIIDLVRRQHAPPEQVFERARQIVRWHYQWIVLHEFLPLCAGQDLVSEICEAGSRLCCFSGRPFVPVEFSDGAYRFGHSQVRAHYDVNERRRHVPLFPNLVGVRSVTEDCQVDWTRLFLFPDAPPPLASRRIRPSLVSPLMKLPEALVGIPDHPEFRSLASRDLYRGRAIGLPSGEAIARSMQLATRSYNIREVPPSDTVEGTPLWLYVLREAAIEQNGERLGEVGGRIVAEVLIELLRSDPTSFLSQPGWEPDLRSSEGSFGMADLLTRANRAQ